MIAIMTTLLRDAIADAGGFSGGFADDFSVATDRVLTARSFISMSPDFSARRWVRSYTTSLLAHTYKENPVKSGIILPLFERIE
jgi:hypothetical protein